MSKFSVTAFISFGLLAACDSASKEKSATPTTGAETNNAAAVVSPAVVTLTGFGSVRAGMTIAEASTALGKPIVVVDTASSCTYVTLPDAPSSVSAMVVDGRIARIDVREGDVATAAGAKIGDDEARIQSLYAGQVKQTPHKYTDGHYLTVSSPQPQDSLYRIVFETDGKKVTRYRSGMRPMVEWVEGCS